jgi:3-oxoacyl-[acyl-carrier protein] reductase
MAGAALVTGGASGIGRATAYALAARGYQVAVDHLGRETEAKQVASDIGGIAYEADVADVTAVDQLVAAVESDLGPIEVAVACAGFDVDLPLEEVTPELWHSSLGVILGGCVNVIAAVGPRMRARRRGSIVGISSELALLGDEDHVPYVTAKSAMIGLVRSVAREYGPDQVRVNVVCPGPTETAMMRGYFEAADDPQAVREMTVGRIRLDRIAAAEEQTAAVLYLATAPQATGAVLNLDGGSTL